MFFKLNVEQLNLNRHLLRFSYMELKYHKLHGLSTKQQTRKSGKTNIQRSIFTILRLTTQIIVHDNERDFF